MRVHPVCGYRSNSDGWDAKWSDEHYRARNLVLAVKRKPFKGYSIWPDSVNKKEWRVDETEQGQAAGLRVAGILLRNRMLRAGIDAATLVPVPSSQSTSPGSDDAGTRLAIFLATHVPQINAAPVLFFDQPIPSAREGGDRSWQAVLPHLRGKVKGLTGPIVLLDDVMTTGGRLRACARYLANKGHDVADALVIRRTVWEEPVAMMKMPTEVIDL